MSKKAVNKKLKKAQDLLKSNIKHKLCPHCGEIIKRNKKTKDFYCQYCEIELL